MTDPYYADDAVTIYHGDAVELLPEFAGLGAHLVLTDPPYFRVVDADWDDQWGPDVGKFLDWIGDVVGMLDAAMADRGTLAMFCAPDISSGIELRVRERMNVLNHVVWRKPGPGRLGQMNKESMRRFFPTSERIIFAERLRNPDGDLFRFRDHVNHTVTREVHEPLIARLIELRDESEFTNREIDEALGKNGMAGHYFGRSQWHLPTAEAWATIAGLFASRGVEVPLWDELRQEFDSRRQEFDSRRREFDSRRQEFDSRRREFDSRRREHSLELLSDVWTFDIVPPRRRIAGHPTQKPEPLIAHIVLTCSRPDDLIIDPFMGTGTTLRVAADTERRAIGIEKDERYCEAAAIRMERQTLGLETA